MINSIDRRNRVQGSPVADGAASSTTTAARSQQSAVDASTARTTTTSTAMRIADDSAVDLPMPLLGEFYD